MTAPVNTVAPVLSDSTRSGTPQVGDTLVVTAGTWTGSPAPTITYQWQSNGVNISGATGVNYIVDAAYAGTAIKCNVLGTNTTSAVTVPSNATVNVNQVPSFTSTPVMSGNNQVGNVLSCTPGAGVGYPAPKITYQWQDGSTNIANATSNIYTLQSSDNGGTVKCVVTSTNTAGSASVTSNITPTIITTPQVTIDGIVGNVLTCNPGTWSGIPAPTITYQWQSNGVNISDATGYTYTVQNQDAGNQITCAVTATNSGGNLTISSNATPAAIVLPANTVAPAITGTNAAGNELSVTTGTWSAYPAPTIGYQWQNGRVNLVGNGATTNTYTVQPSDAGGTLTCNVLATNTLGATTAASNSITIVTSPPFCTVTPVLTGTPNVGNELSVTTGTWTGAPTPTYSYQWLRGSTAISEATGYTYTLVTADTGASISCVVTALNTVSSVPATSNATSNVLDIVTITFNTVGTHTWTCPTGVTSLTSAVGYGAEGVNATSGTDTSEPYVVLVQATYNGGYSTFGGAPYTAANLNALASANLASLNGSYNWAYSTVLLAVDGTALVDTVSNGELLPVGGNATGTWDTVPNGSLVGRNYTFSAYPASGGSLEYATSGTPTTTGASATLSRSGVEFISFPGSTGQVIPSITTFNAISVTPGDIYSITIPYAGGSVTLTYA